MILFAAFLFLVIDLGSISTIFSISFLFVDLKLSDKVEGPFLVLVNYCSLLSFQVYLIFYFYVIPMFIIFNLLYQPLVCRYAFLSSL